MNSKPILVEVSAGELVDKITILEIKAKRIADPDKVANVRRELEALTKVRDEALPPSPRLDELTAQLQAANERLWETEDEIRDCERRKDFGTLFVQLARSVYHDNDCRCAVKRQISLFVHSRLTEEKSYAPYQGLP